MAIAPGPKNVLSKTSFLDIKSITETYVYWVPYEFFSLLQSILASAMEILDC